MLTWFFSPLISGTDLLASRYLILALAFYVYPDDVSDAPGTLSGLFK